MKIVRRLLPCLVLSLASIGRAESATPTPSSAPATSPSPPASLAHLGDLSLIVDAEGYFEPVDPFEVRIRPKAYGGELTIVSIASNGSNLKPGDLLLELDPAPLKRQLAAAENELLANDATLKKTQADAKLGEAMDATAIKQQQAALKQAQEEVDWFEKVDGPQMLKSNDLVVKQAQDQVNDAQDELDQLKKMYKTEELTNATADIVTKRAVRSLDQMKINLAMALERSEKFKTYHFPINKQKVLDSLQGVQYATEQLQLLQAQNKVLRQTGLVGAQAGHDLAAEKVEELKGDLEKLIVRAPFAGTVAYGSFAGGAFQSDARALRPGEHVAAQTVLLTLMAPSKLRVVINLPEAKFDAVKSGIRAALTPVAFPELRMEGTCDAVPRTAAASQGGPVYSQTITLASIDPKLVAGNKVNAHIETKLADHVLLVPTTSVANSTVWVKQANGGDEPVKVVTGRSDGKSIEIIDGIKEGAEILTQAKG